MISPALKAQSIYTYPAGPLSVPAGTYQSVTMPVVGLNNKTVTFTTDCGTITGTNPSTSNEPAAVALYSATAQTCHLTGTSMVNSGLHKTVAITFTASPTPVTTHPRLYITAAMLPALQSNYVPSGGWMPTNITNQGLSWYATLKAAPYNWSFTCESGTGLPSGGSDSTLESAAMTFAMLNMVNYNTTAGTNWGCYGHDVWVYLMNQMTTGSFNPGQDEWRGDADAFIWTTDWLLNTAHPALSASGDVTLARQYVAWMLKYTLTNGFSNFLPTFTGPYNSSSMFGVAVDQMRYMGNNYDEAAFFYLAALPLTFNDNTMDDPTLTNCSGGRYAVCSDGTANSMHAYFNTYFTGALLYDQYAVMEDPNVSLQAYQAKYANLPTAPQLPLISGATGTVPFFGEQRAGEPAEGSGYGYSVYSIRWGLNSIWTAGYADPLVYGPQMSLATSSWWDMRDVVTNEFLTGFKPTNGDPGGTSGVQPAYSYLHTGDAKHYFAQPVDYLTESGLLVFDLYTGRTDRTNALLWPILNTAVGGPAGTAGGCTSQCGIDNNLTNSIAENLNPDLYIALGSADPGGLTPSDPRTSMPTDLYNGSFNQHSMIRSGFTNTDSLLSYYCENSLIEHEHAQCGNYAIYSNNEFITKGRDTFDDDYNWQMNTSQQSNQMYALNVSSGSMSLAQGAQNYWSFPGGGLWHEGVQAGLVNLLHSELPAYAAMIADTTNQYNVGSAYAPDYIFNDVTAASRSMVYLRATHQVVTYDRATSTTANPKGVFETTTGTPTISGNTASWLTQSGTQKAYWTAVLPASLPGTGGQIVNAKVTNAGSGCASPTVAVGSGAGTVYVSQTAGSSVLTLGVSSPSSGYSSAPALTVSNCGAATGTSVVTGTSAVLNNPGLTEAPVNNPPASPATGPDWEVAGTVEANCGATTSCDALTVSEWGPSTLTKSTTTLVSSSAGQAFDGSLVGSSVVMFQRVKASFTGTTFPASGGTSIYVSDLSPSTTYTVTGTGTPGTVTTDTAGIAAFSAAGTGNIALSTGGTPTAATPTFSPSAGTYTGTQSVAITSTTGASTLCYTTDGTTPTANGSGTCTHGTTYSTAVSVTTSLTLKAVASKSGFLDSSVGSAGYVINAPGTGGTAIIGNTVLSGNVNFQ